MYVLPNSPTRAAPINASARSLLQTGLIIRDGVGRTLSFPASSRSTTSPAPPGFSPNTVAGRTMTASNPSLAASATNSSAWDFDSAYGSCSSPFLNPATLTLDTYINFAPLSRATEITFSVPQTLTSINSESDFAEPCTAAAA